MLNPAFAELLKRSRLLTRVAHSVKGIRMLDGIPELDALIAEHDKQHALMDDKAVAELEKVCLRMRNVRMPQDPFSQDYRERVMDMYREISGRPQYSFDFEAAQFDPETEKFDFFPFNTRSPQMVGSQFITQGLILRNISLPPGGSIVELGAGQGNTALNLAMTGYRVTVVEVNQPSIDLILHRARQQGREVRHARQDMLEFVRTCQDQFDAVLFVASFHHCIDHAELVEGLGRIVKKGGSIYFADEPIVHAQSRFLPYPWGMRLDGLSLYFTRRHGWLELGYEAGYFKQVLARAGWRVRTVRSGIPGFVNFYAARRD